MAKHTSRNIRAGILLGIGLGTGVLAGLANAATTTLYYTRFSGNPSVNRVKCHYDGDSISFSNYKEIAQLPGADGLIFADKKKLLIGGEDDHVYRIDKNPGGDVEEASGGGATVFHLAMDPDQQRAWGGGIPGFLTEIPLKPFGDATVRFVMGDDTMVTGIAFAENLAWYTVSDHAGIGNFGIIDLTNFITQRLLTDLPAAHGIIFDPYTGHLILCGAKHVTQFDPVTQTVVSDLETFSAHPELNTGVNDSIDQGSADGKGHYFGMANNGRVVFIDYHASGLVADPANFVAVQFLDDHTDSVAPLSGLGSPAGPNPPSSPASPASPASAPASGF